MNFKGNTDAVRDQKWHNEPALILNGKNRLVQAFSGEI